VMTKQRLSLIRPGRSRSSGISSALAAAGVCLWAGGCTPPPPAAVADGPRNPEPTRVVLSGDWARVDEAVRGAVGRCQLAIESRSAYREVEDGPVTVVDYALRSIRGDSGRLRVRRLGGERGLDVSCRIGAFGAVNAERCVVDGITARLGEPDGGDARSD